MMDQDTMKLVEEVKQMAPYYGFRVLNDDNSPVSDIVLEEVCKSLKADTYATFIVTLIVPPLLFVPVYVLTVTNQCISYATSLYVVLISLSALAFITSYIHLWVYNSISVFCNDRMVKVHNVHTVVLFSFMTATLGFYNCYAIDPSFLYVIAISLTSFITIIEYFVCLFQRRHLYMCATNSCRDNVKDNVLCFKRSKDALNAMGVLFVLSWTGLMIATIFLQSGLYSYVEGQSRPIDECTPLL